MRRAARVDLQGVGKAQERKVGERERQNTEQQHVGAGKF